MTRVPVHAVLDLADAGWAVFPVSGRSKRPLTSHGHLDATLDQRQIHRWWAEYPEASVATPTGNGLLVIDIDPRNGGKVPEWAPQTLTVRTQSGGLHLHYKVDEDITSRAGLFGPGVDSKSKGGYVLVPPSPGYTWTQVQPRTALLAADLRLRMRENSGSDGSAMRLPPEQWQRGIIHDQVVAWAAYFAGQLDDDDVPTAVWAMVDQARANGVYIDNARGHIDSAIRWVMRREANSRAATGPAID